MFIMMLTAQSIMYMVGCLRAIQRKLQEAHGPTPLPAAAYREYALLRDGLPFLGRGHMYHRANDPGSLRRQWSGHACLLRVRVGVAPDGANGQGTGGAIARNTHEHLVTHPPTALVVGMEEPKQAQA